MVAVGSRRLIARDPVTGVDPFHETQVGERFERAVYGGDPHRSPGLAELVVDVLRAQAAALPAEQLHDGGPGSATAVTGFVEGMERVARPGHGVECIFRHVISKIVLIIFLACTFAACGGNTSSNGRKSVIAAFFPVAYAAQRIGGHAYEVENLTPSGVEPHDLELSPRTVARIESGDIVLYLGHGFQPAVSDAAKMATGVRVDVLAGLPVRGDDPHVWLDPLLYERVVRKIAAALHRPATGLLRDVAQLDRDYRNGLRTCKRHEIVTSHEAFGYLARRYGLEQIAITGITPESEPSPQRLAEVVRLVRQTHATTVFFEKLLSPRLAKTVARDVGARTAVLDPIESAAPGETYLSLMRKNLVALRKALACR